MKKAIASGLVGMIALGGTAAAAVPSALAQDDDQQTTTDDHSGRRDGRLDELVAEGVITQEQADQIRERFPEGPRHRGAEARAERLQTLIDVLGVTEDELRAAHEAGQTLADVAAANGVDVQTLIDALVAEANAHIDEKLADGTIDEARAAALREDLVERITARVNGERPERPEGFGGPGGPRPFRGAPEASESGGA